MGRSYTPGLKVSPRTRHRIERRLPIAGTVTVGTGDTVDARQVVAQTSIPGDILPLNMASIMGVPPSDVVDCMLVGVGDAVEAGQIIARTRGIFGMFRSEHAAPAPGTIETLSPVTGQIIIRGAPLPLELEAYLAGRVISVLENEGCVIESEAALVQGIFGIGGETHGPICVASQGAGDPLTAGRIAADMEGAVVVGGGRVHSDAIRKARDMGVSALVVGGIDDRDLRDFLGYDIGVAITGSENMGLTVVVTEGFGDIAMAGRTFSLLKSREGEAAAVNGATQIRAGVLRPEVVIPLPDGSALSEAMQPGTAHELDIGRSVRIVRDPWFGRIGTVAALPPELRVLESGVRARVLEVALDPEGSVIIPRANVELIEG